MQNFNNVEKDQNSPFGLQRIQERFVVDIGKYQVLIRSEDVSYFFTENKTVFMVTAKGERFPTDYTLDEVKKLLQPKIFYRINRQFIVNINAIEKMLPASKSRLKLYLKPETTHETTTSFERTAGFKKWLIGIL